MFACGTALVFIGSGFIGCGLSQDINLSIVGSLILIAGVIVISAKAICDSIRGD